MPPIQEVESNLIIERRLSENNAEALYSAYTSLSFCNVALNPDRLRKEYREALKNRGLSACPIIELSPKWYLRLFETTEVSQAFAAICPESVQETAGQDESLFKCFGAKLSFMLEAKNPKIIIGIKANTKPEETRWISLLQEGEKLPLFFPDFYHEGITRIDRKARIITGALMWTDQKFLPSILKKGLIVAYLVKSKSGPFAHIIPEAVALPITGKENELVLLQDQDFSRYNFNYDNSPLIITGEVKSFTE